MSVKQIPRRIFTGISGLDEVLQGGLLSNRTYLIRGGPGTGKTTLGLHFLAQGVMEGERVLCITLGEPESNIRQNALWIGFNLEGIHFLDLSPTPEFFIEVESYDIFSPAEIEREPITKKIVETVASLKPNRVFIDSMTQFRYFATDSFQFRKQVLSFLRFLVDNGATVMFASEYGQETPDEDLQFLADGVINLSYSHSEGYILNVSKFRGSDFRGGFHPYKLTEEGMKVFPRLIPKEHRREFERELIPSGVPELDALLHGGLERGTTTIITGASGTGKTTLGIQFMSEASRRGERSVVYIFDEGVESLISRCEAINIPVRSMIEGGSLSIVRIEPMQFTPDELANIVRCEVEEKSARIVMLDSLAGYRLSLRGGDLVSRLHALCKYLANMGVTVLIINEVEQITGDFKATERGISYLGDNLIFIRYLEIKGELRKAIGVIKKRLSDFEKTLREYEITKDGIKIGEPLTNLRGILTGKPEWVKGS
ncbi:MAG: hypothetical protein N2260_07685 [Syntrophobacterales bacterium]|nr:hypothetical protein [Syntrophobacterales bacterium]